MPRAAGRYDQAICCGDLVGYGADPNLVVELGPRELRRRGARQSRQSLHRPGRSGVVQSGGAAGGPLDAGEADARKCRVHPRRCQRSADARMTSSWSTARPTTKTNTCWPPERQARRSAIWNAAWPSSDIPTCRAASSGITRAWKPSAARLGAQRQRELGDRPGLRLPDQSRLGGPAARRRSARRLCDLRFRPARRHLFPRFLTTWTARKKRFATPGLPPILADRLMVGR